MAASLRRICVADVVERMEVCTIPFFVKDKRISTIYKLKLRLFPPESYPPYSDLTIDQCWEVISTVFVEAMEDAIQKHLTLLNRIRNIQVAEGGKETEAGGVESDNEEEGTNVKDGEEGEMDGGDVSDGEGADAERRKRQGRDELEYEDDIETEEHEKRNEIDEEDEAGIGNEMEEKEEDYMMEGVETEAEEEVVSEKEDEDTQVKKDKKKKDEKQGVEKKVAKETKKNKTKKKKRKIYDKISGLNFEVHFRFDQDDPRVLLAEVTLTFLLLRPNFFLLHVPYYC